MATLYVPLFFISKHTQYRETKEKNVNTYDKKFNKIHVNSTI